jgi:hypothetical protein
MLADTRMKPITNDSEHRVDLANWLETYIGKDGDGDSCVSIIDLSLVPTEITHLVTAVISRIIFESLQRYRRLYNKSLPTVLVAEEAHTFIKRYREDSENQDVAAVCCQVFEKIAREGRKFGLGMVVSRNDHQNYHLQFYLNVILFFCIELVMTKIRSKFIKWYLIICEDYSVSCLHCHPNMQY